MNVSAIPTENELRGLAVRIPTYFRLALENGHVAMTMFAPGRTPAVPLVTYEVVPGTQPDYAGPLLALMVEEIAAQAVLAHRALRASATAPLMRILQIANDPPVLANRKIAPTGELLARTQKVHTAEVEDWFPDLPASS